MSNMIDKLLVPPSSVDNAYNVPVKGHRKRLSRQQRREEAEPHAQR